jgi:DNA mismatch endonuclease (patch repair protein)
VTDKLSPERRSANMRAVHDRNTKPEMRVRQIVHALGYRFRLHGRDLPGTPDLTFRRLKKVVFVHGCFWHQHPKCKRASMPISNAQFWRAKLVRNVERDAQHLSELKATGWSALVVWECHLRNEERLRRRLQRFLRKS